MMRVKVLGLALVCGLVVGCKPDEGTAPPQAPPPVTEADLSKMPPEAAAHARGMQQYGQAMQQSNAAQNKGRTGQ